jgi:hypothetical protein
MNEVIVDKENVGATGNTLASLGTLEAGSRRVLARCDNLVPSLSASGIKVQAKRGLQAAGHNTLATSASICTPNPTPRSDARAKVCHCAIGWWWDFF